MARLAQLAAFLTAASLSTALTTSFVERQVPANATGITTITSPQGAQIRYKQPGKHGVCETTEGVDDYAGYILLTFPREACKLIDEGFSGSSKHAKTPRKHRSRSG
jgi:hypothetical protein